MLEELKQRLREMDEMTGVRKQSTWHHGSTGSIPSSNGSISYTSPAQSISHPAAMYQQHQQTPPPLQQTPSYGEAQMAQQISPPQFYQQPHVYQQQQQQQPQQFPVQHGNTFALQQPPPPQQHYQQPQQQFNFSEPVYHNASFPAAPRQQFANWTGYGGPSAPDTLDEENAVPPKSNPWELHNT